MRFEGFDIRTATVCCEPSGRKITVVCDTNLLDALLQVGMPVSQACDGVAMCGFCRVQVIEGEENLTPMESEEGRILASLHADDDERLACCARVTGPVTVTAEYWG
jgi:ferredoxin